MRTQQRLEDENTALQEESSNKDMEIARLKAKLRSSSSSSSVPSKLYGTLEKTCVCPCPFHDHLS